jgi:hypothetical protein
MKNMQKTTPGFVLTSLSFKPAESKKNKPQLNQQFDTLHKSSITKFDYCLPPEDAGTAGEPGMNFNSL